MKDSSRPAGPRGDLLSNQASCKAKRSDGLPCRAPAGDTGWCFFHNPAFEAERVEASSRGGSRKAVSLPEVRPLSTEQARGVLASVLSGLLEGSIDPTTARAAGYLVQVDRTVFEKEEFERRIESLEALSATRNGARSSAL